MVLRLASADSHRKTIPRLPPQMLSGKLAYFGTVLRLRSSDLHLTPISGNGIGGINMEVGKKKSPLIDNGIEREKCKVLTISSKKIM